MMAQQQTYRHTGFTLLEVLISVVVLSIGLLGIASLQVKGLRYTQESYFRSQALSLVQDIADRMRANQTGVIAGAYSYITATPGYIDCSTSCSAQQLAQYDLYEWRTRVAAELPSGEGTIDVCAISTPCIITVTWKARSIESSDYISVDTVLPSILTFTVRPQQI